jgi:hypothetical protein
MPPVPEAAELNTSEQQPNTDNSALTQADKIARDMAESSRKIPSGPEENRTYSEKEKSESITSISKYLTWLRNKIEVTNDETIKQALDIQMKATLDVIHEWDLIKPFEYWSTAPETPAVATMTHLPPPIASEKDNSSINVHPKYNPNEALLSRALPAPVLDSSTINTNPAPESIIAPAQVSESAPAIEIAKAPILIDSKAPTVEPIGFPIRTPEQEANSRTFEYKEEARNSLEKMRKNLALWRRERDQDSADIAKYGDHLELQRRLNRSINQVNMYEKAIQVAESTPILRAPNAIRTESQPIIKLVEPPLKPLKYDEILHGEFKRDQLYDYLNKWRDETDRLQLELGQATYRDAPSISKELDNAEEQERIWYRAFENYGLGEAKAPINKPEIQSALDKSPVETTSEQLQLQEESVVETNQNREQLEAKLREQLLKPPYNLKLGEIRRYPTGGLEIQIFGENDKEPLTGQELKKKFPELFKPLQEKDKFGGVKTLLGEMTRALFNLSRKENQARLKAIEEGTEIPPMSFAEVVTKSTPEIKQANLVKESRRNFFSIVKDFVRGKSVPREVTEKASQTLEAAVKETDKNFTETVHITDTRVKDLAEEHPSISAELLESAKHNDPASIRAALDENEFALNNVEGLLKDIMGKSAEYLEELDNERVELLKQREQLENNLAQINAGIKKKEADANWIQEKIKGKP